MVTLHEVITFLVSMQISISSLQTHNVNRCGRSRHLARKLSLRRKRSSQMTTSTTSIDIMGLQAAYANLHTDQERDYFMQRYHDVITFLVSMQISISSLQTHNVNRCGRS